MIWSHPGAIAPAATPASDPEDQQSSRSAASSIRTLFEIAAWFGVVAGFGEGFGLLLFQKINWAQWARMMHVSKEILWISPVVDCCFFLLIGFAVAVTSRVFTRLPATRTLGFVLIFLTAYDWL